MNVFDAIKKRRSIRSFLETPVEEEKLNAVLEAARLAPSAKNFQEWRFIIVKNRKVREKIAQASNEQTFIGEAPVVIVACAVTDGYVLSCGQLCYPIDVAIALDHISLVAVELGLGTCWIGAFNEKKVKQILGIPEEVRVVELMPLGYPSFEGVKDKIRLPFEKIVKHDRW
ncbi:MAG: nitroreductase family protein, partial [Candidatus Bathyarchaeota archaeon]|nr:nitroreductase family protein [Candidatus Bathyarchaeota archaeon]